MTDRANNSTFKSMQNALNSDPSLRMSRNVDIAETVLEVATFYNIESWSATAICEFILVAWTKANIERNKEIRRMTLEGRFAGFVPNVIPHSEKDIETFEVD